MNHLRQDRPLNCGQTCVAILLNRTIKSVEKKIGKKGKTTTRDLKSALESKYTFPKRMILFKSMDTETFPKIALVGSRHPVSGKHWIVMECEKDITICDPSHEFSFTWEEYKELMINYKLKMTSYLPLQLK